MVTQSRSAMQSQVCDVYIESHVRRADADTFPVDSAIKRSEAVPTISTRPYRRTNE